MIHGVERVAAEDQHATVVRHDGAVAEARVGPAAVGRDLAPAWRARHALREQERQASGGSEQRWWRHLLLEQL